jgi:hypothetical protein
VRRAWRFVQRRVVFHPQPGRLGPFRLVRGLVATPLCFVAAVVLAARQRWLEVGTAIVFAILFAPRFTASWRALTAREDKTASGP